jgi:ComF family protein
MFYQIGWLFEELLGLIYPERCVVCGWAGGLICAPCRSRLEGYPPAPTPAGLDAMTVAWLYGDEARQAIHALKYRRQRRVALALADAMAGCLPAPPSAALIPVPLHPRRMAERGFNQAEELARRLGWRWRMPVCAQGLMRGRATGHQARLGRQARQENVAGAFVWRARRPPPARVLLVDDVLTTGATLVACADALRAAGSREVRAVALARSLAPGQSVQSVYATMG